MEFSLLGDITARQNGHLLRLTVKQRAVLAVLLFWHGEIVRRSEVIRLAWGNDAPATIDRLIGDYVGRLRQAIQQSGAGGEVTLTSRPPGFVLEVRDETTIDWHRFRRLIDRARRAQDAADLEGAARLLWDGLALWRGPALADADATLDPLRELMEDRRLSAAEDLATIELTREGSARVLPMLSELAATHPGRERLDALLIQALHASGRREEAIEVYQRGRRHAADLGLDPAPALEAAYRALLVGKPAGKPRLHRSGPAQLPLDTSNFTGRSEELARLLALVPIIATVPTPPVGPAEPDAHLSPATGELCVVDGMAGVGKTAFAIHAAHRLAPWFPDGQLYLDLHGYTAQAPRVEPAEALDRLLRTLGVAVDKIPQHLDDRAALYRDRLAGKRMLILLDNASTAEQVRPLLPATTDCLVLVTSRRRLAALDDAHPLTLDTLPQPDAIALFGRAAGPERICGQHEVVERIAELCGGLPLAIRIVAARLRNRPAWEPRHLLDRLCEVHDQPWDLDDGERSIAAAFTLSYRELSGERRRIFRSLGLVPGRDVDSYSAAALIDASPARAAQLLQDLLDVHLVTQQVDGRYQLHDLMRRFAADLAVAEDPAEARAAALGRLLHHHLSTASAATDVLFPHERDRRPRLPAPTTAPAPDVSTSSAARAWLDVERPNLIAAAAHAVESDRPDHTQLLALALHRYLITGAHYAAALDLHRHALRAAIDRPDRAGEGAVHYHLGNTYLRLGSYATARREFEAALVAHREVGMAAAEAIALTNLGATLGLQGQYGAAIDPLRQALALDREVGDPANEANTLANLGNVYLMIGSYDAALEHYEQALRMFAEIGDRAGEGQVLNNLGHIQLRTGGFEKALTRFQQALAVATQIGDRAGQGMAMSALGEAYERHDQYDVALNHLVPALEIFRSIGHRPWQGEALSLLASAYAGMGRHQEAARHFDQALRIADEIGDNTLKTTILNEQGRMLRASGDPDRARTAHESALHTARLLGNRYEQALALEGLADLLETTGQWSRVRQFLVDACDICDDLGVEDSDRLRTKLQRLPPPATSAASTAGSAAQSKLSSSR